MVVLPSTTQPASLTRAAGGASAVAGVKSPAAVPIGVGAPAVAILSLMVIGTPSSGLRAAPLRQRASDAAACIRAPSALLMYIALIRFSHRSSRAGAARVASTGESCPVR